MASEDQVRTSVRQFRCRDRLWATFEQMSEELEKPVEELINDAMTSYAQLAGHEPVGSEQLDRSTENDRTPVPTPGPITLPTPSRVGRSPLGPPSLPAGAARFPPGPPRGGRSTAASVTPPAPPLDAGSAATLYLVFENQKYPIDKEQFIIGRGSKSSDLPIRDGNVSRKHAAVIRRNGAFFIKDLGSTNGIDFKGMRIDNKRIDEGDVFHICEYELKFTYKR
jgi:hypothetical protein